MIQRVVSQIIINKTDMVLELQYLFQKKDPILFCGFQIFTIFAVPKQVGLSISVVR